jgi:predicted ATPase
MINKISFKNYKLFKEKQILELRPITVLIGKNNSGKSAVLKIPTMISGALSSEFEEPVRLNNYGVKIGINYSDLVYNKKLINPLEIEIENGNEKLELKIKFPDKPKEKTEFFEWNYYLDSKLIYKKSNDSEFIGFVNKKIDFKDLNIDIDYIGAFRELPEDSYTYNGEKYNNIGYKGEKAYPILINDSVNGANILSKVSKWYEENFENWKIEVVDFVATDPFYQIVLTNKNISRINIVNTGQGINQVLPLIVRSFMPDVSKVLITIEEPETHLHPAAHANLAERLVKSYLENTNKNYADTCRNHFESGVIRLIFFGTWWSCSFLCAPHR